MVPVALGVRGLVAAIRARGAGQDASPVVATGLVSVAGVTFPNGADNLSVYKPMLHIIGVTDGLVTVAVVRAARNTALAELAADLPPPETAQPVGIAPTTATRWARHARRDWSPYLAARARSEDATHGNVATVTLAYVTEWAAHGRWLVVTIRLAASPSRHRVAVWRELRRIGAVPLGGGTWAAPAASVFADGLEKVAELVRRADGSVLTLQAQPHTDTDAAALLAEFNAARAAEWAEFVSECDKFEIEIAKERRLGKLTVAELDEEEHSLDRLRRWWRDLKARDIFAVAEGVDAEDRLKRCTQTLDAYADEVYRAVHAPLGRSEPDA